MEITLEDALKAQRKLIEDIHNLYLSEFEANRQLAADLEKMRERAELAEARLKGLTNVVQSAVLPEPRNKCAGAPIVPLSDDRPQVFG
jgi:hypothetical protein